MFILLICRDVACYVSNRIQRGSMEKITVPFLIFFRVLNSDSLPPNLGILQRRSMLRLYPDTTRFNGKNHRTIFKLIPCFESNSLQLNLGILQRRSMLRLYHVATRLNRKINHTIFELIPCFEFQFITAKFGYLYETQHATSLPEIQRVLIKKNHRPISEFFLRFDSDSLQLNLGICTENKVIRFRLGEFILVIKVFSTIRLEEFQIFIVELIISNSIHFVETQHATSLPGYNAIQWKKITVPFLNFFRVLNPIRCN